MNHFTQPTGILACIILLSACSTEEPGQATTAASVPDSAITRGKGICRPYSISNDRRKDVGFDLCTDGRVFNWDGDFRGTFVTSGSGLVTINWNDTGPWWDRVETYSIRSVRCRGDGELRDC